MPTKDTTIVAQWEKVVVSDFVEIIFDRKNMTEEEVKKVLKDIIQDNFTIEKVENDKGTGEIKIIFRFNDPEKAKDFVRTVSEGRVPNIIKRAKTVPFEKDFTIKIKRAKLALLIFFLWAVTTA